MVIRASSEKSLLFTTNCAHCSHILTNRLIDLLLISLVQKGQYGRIEEKLRLLANGNYESPVLNKPTTSENQDHYLTEVEQDIWSIKNKLLEMSKNCNY